MDISSVKTVIWVLHMFRNNMYVLVDLLFENDFQSTESAVHYFEHICLLICHDAKYRWLNESDSEAS